MPMPATPPLEASPRWLDSHAHLDFLSAATQANIAQQSPLLGLGPGIIPAVAPSNFAAVRQLAQQHGWAYALGIHPLYVAEAGDAALAQLQAALNAHSADPRLLAVGEIGLDFFDPKVNSPALKQQQTELLRGQLRLAQSHGLPVLLHLRQSADAVLAELRRARFAHGGIAHAFNGSLQQAEQFLKLGFKLGFGGATTYARAQHLQKLLRQLPAEAIVLETDSPDMPPAWLYTPKHEREQGMAQAPNTPLELPRIAAFIADVRGCTVAALQTQCQANTLAALPRLAALL